MSSEKRISMKHKSLKSSKITQNNLLCNNLMNRSIHTFSHVNRELRGNNFKFFLGFRYFLVNCIDIDECGERIHNCTTGEICHNTEGDFRCEKTTRGTVLPLPDCPKGFQVRHDKVKLIIKH